MTRKIDGATDAPVEADLFSQGWLDRQIDAVVSEIATWPDDLRPQLTGARAEVMRGFDWAKFVSFSTEARRR